MVISRYESVRETIKVVVGVMMTICEIQIHVHCGKLLYRYMYLKHFFFFFYFYFCRVSHFCLISGIAVSILFSTFN